MLHKNLQKLIFERKVSKLEFAKEIGVARSTLDGYISGKTPMPSDKIEKTATYFNVSIAYLFNEKKPNDSMNKKIAAQQKQIEIIKKQIEIIANSLQIKI